ncbi:MAG TPA: hypothetical protein VGM53_28715 [Streptosporangiaceae bacterium]|jgi:hypothetical protein
MAVGTYLDGSQDLAMAEHWNGTAWSVTAQVPHGATTGKIKVTTPGGTATSATSFKVT